MKRYLTLPALALVLAVAGPAAGYETLEEDFSVCLGGPDQSSKDAVVTACTRLIDNAQAENAIVARFTQCAPCQMRTAPPIAVTRRNRSNWPTSQARRTLRRA